MRRALPLFALVLVHAQPAAAQYGQQQSSFKFTGDTLARYEWTLKIPTPEGTIDENRYLIQARPRIELSLGPVELGVGGQFNYSKDDNTKRPDGTDRLIVRDNFFSRDARFDLYYAKVEFGPVELEGGQMLMPFFLTGMIWDEDLRPRGGAASIVIEDQGSFRFALRGLYANGSHWFEDESEMFGGSVELSFVSGQNSQIVLAGSYLDFRKLEGLDPRIRRQNTRDIDGFLANDYRVADIQARLVNTGQVPFHIAIDYCWNTALDEGHKGLWAEVQMGALASSRVVMDYTYARIDRDATVAAFNADDFYYGTGYEAHRVDLGSATSQKSSIHGVASWQRVRDRTLVEPSEWIQRYRIEWRYEF